MNLIVDEIIFDLESEFLETRRNALLRLVSMENISEPLKIQLLKAVIKNENDPLLKEFAEKKLNSMDSIEDENIIKVKRHDENHPDASDVSLDSVFNGFNNSLKLDLLGLIKSGEKRTSKFKLVEYLSKQDDPSVICGLIEIITSLGNSNDAFTIKDFLLHENTKVKLSAIESIVTLKNNECLKYVFSLILDTDSDIYRKVSETARKMPVSEVVELISDWIDSKNQYELKCAIKILRLFEMSRVYNYLQKAESNFLKLQKEK